MDPTPLPKTPSQLQDPADSGKPLNQFCPQTLQASPGSLSSYWPWTVVEALTPQPLDQGRDLFHSIPPQGSVGSGAALTCMPSPCRVLKNQGSPIHPHTPSLDHPPETLWAEGQP